MDSGASALLSSKLQVQATTLKRLKTGMGKRDLFLPMLFFVIVLLIQGWHRQEVMPYVLSGLAFGLTAYTFVQARILHERIDAVIVIIGDEAIQRRLSGELKEIADLTAGRSDEDRKRV